MRAAGREIRNNCAEPGPGQATVPLCGSRVSIATGAGKLAGPAMSAMPRNRPLVVKESSVAMGHEEARAEMTSAWIARVGKGAERRAYAESTDHGARSDGGHDSLCPPYACYPRSNCIQLLTRFSGEKFSGEKFSEEGALFSMRMRSAFAASNAARSSIDFQDGSR